jgi:hypothetical protein
MTEDANPAVQMMAAEAAAASLANLCPVRLPACIRAIPCNCLRVLMTVIFMNQARGRCMPHAAKSVEAREQLNKFCRWMRKIVLL